ncbi:MAG: hypothetical protein ACK5KN_11495 [Dysgonomonas sp.]|uniref:hypothetical protein n=1 Tax=Dysgonomonas sp. TaxID=1891233 RepID=UPI003A83C214
MKIIYNKYLPPKGYVAINICGIIFARSRYNPLSERTICHETIHTRQIAELLVVIFYLWYGIEWIVRLIQYRSKQEAYRNISFEREAYANDQDDTYLKRRKLYAFIGYLKGV